MSSLAPSKTRDGALNVTLLRTPAPKSRQNCEGDTLYFHSFCHLHQICRQGLACLVSVSRRITSSTFLRRACSWCAISKAIKPPKEYPTSTQREDRMCASTVDTLGSTSCSNLSRGDVGCGLSASRHGPSIPKMECSPPTSGARRNKSGPMK